MKNAMLVRDAQYEGESAKLMARYVYMYQQCFCLHTYIHTYIHTHIHIYIHTYIHTHTHTCCFLFFVKAATVAVAVRHHPHRPEITTTTICQCQRQ